MKIISAISLFGRHRNLVNWALQRRNYAAAAASETGRCCPSMADLSSPAGSWQEQNARDQLKYNAVLAGGIVFFGAAFYTAREWINLTWYPESTIQLSMKDFAFEE